MDTFWEKLKFWTKTILLMAVALYAILFMALNWSAVVDPGIHLLFQQYDRPRLLLILLVDSVISIIGWWLLWTLLRALRQRRQAVDRKRLERLERATAEMQQKAGSLRTRPELGEGLTTSDPLA